MPTIQQLVRKGREVLVEKSKSPAFYNQSELWGHRRISKPGKGKTRLSTKF